MEFVESFRTNLLRLSVLHSTTQLCFACRAGICSLSRLNSPFIRWEGRRRRRRGRTQTQRTNATLLRVGGGKCTAAADELVCCVQYVCLCVCSCCCTLTIYCGGIMPNIFACAVIYHIRKKVHKEASLARHHLPFLQHPYSQLHFIALWHGGIFLLLLFLSLLLRTVQYEYIGLDHQPTRCISFFQ